jgi:hypothetical protein
VKSCSTWFYIVSHAEPRLPTHHPDARLRSLLDLDVTVIARSLSYRWISGIDAVKPRSVTWRSGVSAAPAAAT